MADDRTAVESLAADLRLILTDGEVPDTIQAQMARAGMKSLSLFVLISEDPSSLRATLVAAPFGLDPAEAGIAPELSLERKINQARILDAWEVCKGRREEERKIEAQSRARNEPIVRLKSEHIQTRSKYEAAFGKLTGNEYHAFSYL